MKIRFNEKDVKNFYRLLNHRYLTELRFLKRGYFPAFSLVKNENDRIFDLPKIGKVIGTLSVKGENKKERPWRLSYFIDQPKRIEDEKLLKTILKGKI